jgi:hypothetical protein
MCHLVAPLASSAADRRDLDFSERLAMTLSTPVVLTAPEFDDDDLVLATLRDDLRLDLAATDERCTDFDAGALADEQHLIERDSIANGRVEALYANALTLTGAVLLTASTENGIHDEVLLSENREAEAPRKGSQF